MGSTKVATKPKQLIPLSQKTSTSKNAKEWRQTNVDYYCGSGSMYFQDNLELEYLYKLAQGYLDENEYKYITNPLNTNVDRTKSYPARLRNYDIISPIVQMLLGEKTKRKSDPVVWAINSDISTIKERELTMMINGTLDQIVINAINEIQQTPVASKPPSTIEEINNQVESIKDAKAITGQQVIEYIYTVEELNRKFRQGFNDMVVTSHVYSKKCVIDNNVHYDLFSPVNCGYRCSDTTMFMEDGEAAWVKDYMTLSDILDEFHDDLKPEEVKRLEENKSDSTIDNTTIYATSDRDKFMGWMRSSGGLDRLLKAAPRDSNYIVRDDMHEVTYVNWKSKVKVGRLQGTDIFGNPFEMDVEEGFKPREGETVTWRWVNQAWEGTRITDDIYVRIRPIPYQRGTFDNPSKCKLLINGYTQHGRHYFSKSVVSKLEPYQHRYNAIHWHIEKMMNKNKDKITLMPKSLIPDDEDMDMFDMLHFADSDGFLFLDEVDPKRLTELNAVKVLDMSLKDYLQQLYNALAFLRAEAEEVVGVTRQRKGQTHASDGKQVTEQAIFQSAIISEEIFLEYEEFEEREYQGLLDISKYAYRDGKKSWFVNSDKRKVLLDVLGEEHRETEYGTMVSNGREKQEKLKRIREQSQAFIQNAAKPSLVLKMENSDNIEELIQIVEQEEEKMAQQAAEAAANEAQAAEDQLEFEREKHQDEMNLKLYEIDNKTLMSAQASAGFDNTDDNDIKREDLEIKRENNRIKREDIQAKMQMNRENNITKLKNPVSGEKK